MKLFQKMSNNRSRCLLCPRYCELSDGQTGACHARINKSGEIFPLPYGISGLAVEPIEKKPLTHFLPGTKTLSLGGYSCNLRCKYCENFSISQSGPHSDAKYMSPKNIIEIAKEKHCPSICMTYNEPTLAIEYLLDLGKACHENDLKFIIKTNAYINREPWKEVCKVVDSMNIDYKGAGEHFEDITQCRYEYSNNGNFQYKMIDAYDRNVHIELSIPVFPNMPLGEWYFLPLKEAFNYTGRNIHCHLLKVNPAHLMINSPTTSDLEIEKAKQDLSYIFPEKYIHI